MTASESHPATRVVVSYPAALSAWGQFQVEKPSFRAYLRRRHDHAEPGDTWDEFVGVGCCGDALDVSLRVERVDGGPALDEETTVEYTTRDGCDVRGGWAVQSAAGPNATTGDR